jgi:hypothetical protein
MPPKYQKMNPIEHILHRPDLYVGSNRSREMEEYISDQSNEYKIKMKNIKLSPAFAQVFREVLSNAVDNVTRSKKSKNKCTEIKVNIDKNTGICNIWNDGEWIPINKENEEKCYNHTLIFGHLLTSSNYDDTDDRLDISGRNGLGVKLCLKTGTKIPLWNGKILNIEDLKIGDVVIGDDGNKRNITNITNGSGKLYKVSQPRGDDYIVNEHHILTVRMPDHKVIFWNNTKKGWSMLWLNNKEKSINMKSVRAYSPSIVCEECGSELTDNINRHYRQKHFGLEIPKKERNSPTLTPPNEEMYKEEIKNARKKIEQFRDTISDDNTIDISIQEYMKLPKTSQGRLTGFRGECVNWNKQDIKLDPYVLGLWLGDGYQSGYGFAINSDEDPEILEYLEKWGKDNDATFKQNQNNNKVAFGVISTSKCNIAPLKKLLSKYNLVNNKHIPQEYLLNDRDTRLAVLAGLIDSDGYCTKDRNGRRVTIAQGMNHEKLAYEIVYLARSLGFMCNYTIKKTQWKYEGEIRKGQAVNINISGEGLEDIPTKVLRKQCNSPSRRNTSNMGKLKIDQVEDGN